MLLLGAAVVNANTDGPKNLSKVYPHGSIKITVILNAVQDIDQDGYLVELIDEYGSPVSTVQPVIPGKVAYTFMVSEPGNYKPRLIAPKNDGPHKVKVPGVKETNSQASPDPVFRRPPDISKAYRSSFVQSTTKIEQ